MSDIKTITQQINEVINETNEHVSQMKDGENIKIPQLADTISAKTNIDSAKILPIVLFVIRDLDGGRVQVGRKGGYYKGKLQEKLEAKKTKKSKAIQPDIEEQI